MSTSDHRSDVVSGTPTTALVEKRATVIAGAALLTYNRTDINVDVSTRLDMTAEAAAAQKEIARMRYETPAKEHTAQIQEMTKWETQFTIRHYGVVVAVVIMALLVFLKPTAALGISALGAVLGGVYLGTTYITKKQERGGKSDVDADMTK